MKDREALKVEAQRCYCPDDCNCHYPWRPNYCGCRNHEHYMLSVEEFTALTVQP